MSNSTYISSSQAAPKRLLATALGLALVSGAAHAADVAAEADGNRAVQTPDAADKGRKDDTTLDAVDVQGLVNNAEPVSPKYTAQLRDTPQTISVVPQKIMKEQNLLSLRDVLSTLPGITFGAGEGGGGFGDSINLRGFTASNDILVDGVRDSAQYSRSDTFNLEQIEVVNGANSVYAGAGSVGGSVNLVSKMARSGDFTNLTAAVGTDAYARTTLDMNQMVGDTTAVRVNVMGHRNDAPGRDFEDFKRWGFAPSIAFGVGTDTTLTLSYLHQKDDNIPQYGVPYFIGATRGFALPGVDTSTYYGYRNIDKQEIEVDAFTAILQHKFSDNLSVRNFSRIQEVTQLTVVDPPQGVFCLSNNLTPLGAACIANPTTPATSYPVPVNTYSPSGPRGNTRDTTNRMFVNQTDITSTFNTGSVGHTLVTGFAFTHETFDLDTIQQFRNADGSNPYAAPNHLPFTDPFHPDQWYGGPINPTLSGRTDGELDNAALYAFDTLKFNEHWEFNLGGRYERNEGKSTVYTVQANPTATVPAGAVTNATRTTNDEDLFSYRAGLVYKPVENASIYVAYGNSKTPSKASVNGACTAVALPGQPATAANNCNVDPESAVNIEVGTKWDVLDNRLSLTASVFRNDRENYRVNDALNPENPAQTQQLDGRARVDGVALGATGLVTDHWAVYANYTYLDSEVLQGASNFEQSNGRDYTKGDPLLVVPKHSASLWTTYDWNGWQFGYGATYSGEYYLSQHNATNVNGPLAKAPSYWVHRAMVAYNVSHELRLQLNVNNLFDKDYFTRIRTATSGWATPGDARQVVLSATYAF